MKIQQILVPIDFSSHSAVALESAIELAANQSVARPVGIRG